MMDLRESFTKFYRILDILISASNPFVGPHLKDFELTDTFYVVDTPSKFESLQYRDICPRVLLYT